MRPKRHDPDGVLTLFSLGCAVNKLLDERLGQLKASRADASKALPLLAESSTNHKGQRQLQAWLERFPTPKFDTTPLGRRIPGAAPEELDLLLCQLLGYRRRSRTPNPLPHFVRPETASP